MGQHGLTTQGALGVLARRVVHSSRRSRQVNRQWEGRNVQQNLQHHPIPPAQGPPTGSHPQARTAGPWVLWKPGPGPRLALPRAWQGLRWVSHRCRLLQSEGQSRSRACLSWPGLCCGAGPDGMHGHPARGPQLLCFRLSVYFLLTLSSRCHVAPLFRIHAPSRPCVCKGTMQFL